MGKLNINRNRRIQKAKQTPILQNLNTRNAMWLKKTNPQILWVGPSDGGNPRSDELIQCGAVFTVNICNTAPNAGPVVGDVIFGDLSRIAAHFFHDFRSKKQTNAEEEETMELKQRRSKEKVNCVWREGKVDKTQKKGQWCDYVGREIWFTRGLKNSSFLLLSQRNAENAFPYSFRWSFFFFFLINENSIFFMCITWILYFWSFDHSVNI